MAAVRGRGEVLSGAPRPITDEPVRGVVTPPWVFSLPRIDGLRLYARRLLPLTPIVRLTGTGLGHVSVGSITATMKASGHLAFPPAYNLSVLTAHALHTCALTAVDAGYDVDPIVMSTQYYRPPRPQPGNFVAHARVLNASRVFISCAVDIEDPVGRLVGFATSQWRIRKVDPPPPSAPPAIEPPEEAVYATPDPPDRPTVGGLPSPEMQATHGGLELLRMIASGDLQPLPLMHTFGGRLVDVEEGTIRVTMPASEWFSSSTRNLDAGAIETALNMGSTLAAVSLWEPGRWLSGLENTTRFLRPVPADGRDISVRGKVRYRVGNLIVADAEAVDADGHVVAAQNVTYVVLDPRERRKAEVERVITTLLFTDIVDSTRHAERMGDARWKELLEEHHALIRQELGAHQGRAVNTTGDGFLARFDSPAQAVRCARSIRDAMNRLKLEIRAGIHTGECEVHGTDLAGIALHIAARIVSLAGPSEVLVSQTVKDLTAGSGLRFEARGAHSLKGVEGDFNLFLVED